MKLPESWPVTFLWEASGLLPFPEAPNAVEVANVGSMRRICVSRRQPCLPAHGQRALCPAVGIMAILFSGIVMSLTHAPHLVLGSPVNPHAANPADLWAFFVRCEFAL